MVRLRRQGGAGRPRSGPLGQGALQQGNEAAKAGRAAPAAEGHPAGRSPRPAPGPAAGNV